MRLHVHLHVHLRFAPPGASRRAFLPAVDVAAIFPAVLLSRYPVVLLPLLMLLLPSVVLLLLLVLVVPDTIGIIADVHVDDRVPGTPEEPPKGRGHECRRGPSGDSGGGEGCGPVPHRGCRER